MTGFPCCGGHFDHDDHCHNSRHARRATYRMCIACGMKKHDRDLRVVDGEDVCVACMADAPRRPASEGRDP